MDAKNGKFNITISIVTYSTYMILEALKFTKFEISRALGSRTDNEKSEHINSLQVMVKNICMMSLWF
jgi:hypothetical protein